MDMLSCQKEITQLPFKHEIWTMSYLYDLSPCKSQAKKGEML